LHLILFHFILLILYNTKYADKLENRKSYRHADPRRQRLQVAQRRIGVQNTVNACQATVMEYTCT